jgi:hypothetical protein
MVSTFRAYRLWEIDIATHIKVTYDDYYKNGNIETVT